MLSSTVVRLDVYEKKIKLCSGVIYVLGEIVLVIVLNGLIDFFFRGKGNGLFFF